MVKYVFDLDDTLVATTALNNDAYNYALEKHGYSRITTRHRITRNELDYIPKEKLNEIIADKQLYFSRKWLPCRVILNNILLNKIKKLGQKKLLFMDKRRTDAHSCNLKIMPSTKHV